jgi:hypothetical protein
MKNLLKKMMVAAAALAVVAGVASAQGLKAEVPFSFHAAGTTMPAGTYWVSSLSDMSGVPMFRLLSVADRKPVIVLSRSGVTKGKGLYSDAKLVFRCTDGNCSLAQIWTGTAHGAYEVPTPKARTADEKASLIEIVAERTKAE